ncbi:glycosyltransferase [Cedecea neteri]|uniref:glycosyltransferase n=1 Tax=Cedecea neteri TaxID=158822 RepID=UPI0004F771E0|nr:glycosyltransferase [Cedecea neteri]AIR64297.1 hypothetical protein LH86_04130 [Cedecea neteri]
MKICVVIPTYNDSDALLRTLNSLAVQKMNDSNSFDVVVVDDGSMDDTRTVCDMFTFVRYFYHQDKGFRAAKARNIGAAISEGEYIVFLDSGLVCHNHFINNYLNYFDKNQDVDVFLGKIFAFNHDEDILSILHSTDYVFDDRTLALFNERGVIDMRDPRFDLLGYDLSNHDRWKVFGDILWTGNVCVSRDAFYRVGLFDETFNSWGGEDIDLGIRLQKIGCKFYFAKQCFTVHIPHVSGYSEEMCKKKELVLAEKHKDIAYMKYFSLAREQQTDINTYLYLHVENS